MVADQIGLAMNRTTSIWKPYLCHSIKMRFSVRLPFQQKESSKGSFTSSAPHLMTLGLSDSGELPVQNWGVTSCFPGDQLQSSQTARNDHCLQRRRSE